MRKSQDYLRLVVCCLVFTQNETHAITNFPDPRTISRTLVDDEQGCVNIRTPKFLKGYPVWISNDGICTFNNGRVDVISRDLLGDDFFQGNIITTEVHNDVYYILYDDRIVIMDNRFRTQTNYGVATATNFRTFDTNGVRWFEKFKGEDVFYGTTTDNTVVEMFAGDADLTMSYTSGIITLVGEARIKRFENLYVAFKQTGQGLTIKSKLYGQNIAPLETTYPIKDGVAVIDPLLPNDSYYGIQFEITGTGEISSIDFSVKSSEKKPT